MTIQIAKGTGPQDLRHAMSYTTGTVHLAKAVAKRGDHNVTVYQQACGISRRQLAYLHVSTDIDALPLTCKRCEAIA